MNNTIIGFIYLFSSIIAGIASQLLIKWRVTGHIITLLPMPNGILHKIFFLIKVLFDPFIFLACIFTLIAGLLWMATMTKMEISYAYPFTTLGFIAVLLLSVWLFGESINIYKIVGCLVIIVGVIITSRGL